MKYIFYFLFFAILFITSNIKSIAQNIFWTDISEKSFSKRGKQVLEPTEYRTVELDISAFQIWFKQLPTGSFFEARHSNYIMTFPLPDGTWENFKIIESSILSPELAQKLPNIKTFAGISEKGGSMLRMDWTPKGLHAIIFTTEGTIYIDPHNVGDIQHYIVYYKKNYHNQVKAQHNWSCLVKELRNPNKKSHPLHNNNKKKEEDQSRQNGAELRTYRLAVAATGEYTQFHNDGDDGNGTAIEDAQAAIVTTMNRVTGIYEREISVSFTLVDNADIVFDDGSTDPFTNNNAGVLIGESQTVIDAEIGSANYDVGHTVSTGAGGLASLGVICTGSKARGVTGLSNPIGDPFDVDFVAHEIGHQFGGSHTFNGSSGSCAGNRSGGSAYEPGSGTTIMAYAGICGSQNIQSNSNDYFHSRSYDQMLDHTLLGSGNNCPTITNTGNNIPVADAGTGGQVIPINTPFALVGSGTDDDADPITFCWEQYDLGPQGAPNSPTGNAPLFRSFSPIEEPSRTFPQMSDIVNNTQTQGEILPDYARDLNFRLTVRDGLGGVDYDEITFEVTDQAGPFLVISPNTGITLQGGFAETITWDVANTDLAPVNVSQVNILLSTDGGFTYPTTLASNVDNDGSHTVIIPNIATTTARIKVEAVDNIFFDISNSNFTITETTSPTFSLSANNESQSICSPDNTTFDLNINDIAGFTGNVTLSTSGLPSGLNASFSNNPVNTSGTSTLTISNTSSVSANTYNFDVEASNGGTTRTLSLSLSIFDNTFSAPNLLSPNNNAVSIGLNPTLDWEDVAGVSSYDVQLATDASFTNIILAENNIVPSEYSLASSLNSGTQYFWRVRANTPCGATTYSSAFNFMTFNCTSYASTDVPINISSSGTPTITSTIEITDDFSISDLNINVLQITHSWINDLTITLTSPDGTVVSLLDRICGNQDNIDVSLDDEAMSDVLPCPPTDGEAYQPEGSLADFIGESSLGTWTLTITDNVNQDGGSLDNWSLEICTTDINNELPVVEVNAGINTFPNASSYRIDNTILRSSDIEDENNTLTYIILQKPSNGNLLLNSTILDNNDSFTQGDINNFLITYEPSDVNANITDNFNFIVRDSNGGETITNTFNIVIDIINSNENITLTSGTKVYPNPSENFINLELNFAHQGKYQCTIVDAVGKTVKTHTFEKDRRKFIYPINLDKLSIGTYIIKIESDLGNITKRLVKIK